MYTRDTESGSLLAYLVSVTVPQLPHIESRGMKGRPTRVFLADDHTMFRQGLTRVLASHEGIEVVGEAPNDEGVISLAREIKPDVVVMEVRAPFERAKRSLSEMLGISPPPRIIIVSTFENPRHVRELMGLGASAYLSKSASVDRLLGAIRAADFDSGGESAVVGMPREPLERAGGWPEGRLTAREVEVLLLAARGLSNRRIASRLCLSEATVKRHLSNVYAEMGVSSRTEAARKALDEGWITIGELTEGDGG